MPKATIAIGADHGGYDDKTKLCRHLKERGYRVIDMGTVNGDATDYPIYGFRVAEAVERGQAQFGVLLCRSGNGMAMAANKVRGVRAAIATNVKLAQLARQHNDANVLIMGSDFMEHPTEEVLDAFLEAAPEDGRHARRVDLIKQYDKTLSSNLPTHQLAAFGQSPWMDDISDTLIASGELKRWVEEKGIRGLTSNPSIFDKAISGGQGRYSAELAKMSKAGVSTEDAYEKLTTEDIASAADILRPLYDATGGDDGFVSLEVLPAYAYDEEKTVSEAARLFKLLNRPNIMIKVPGTVEGIRSFRRLTAEGININVTLIFSRKFYNDIARAYVAGLKDRRAAGKEVARIRSVASVFVSRIDTSVDKTLAEMKTKDTDPARIASIDSLLHQIAIANTRLIYDDFKTIFYGEEFAALAEAGAAPQRPLWGSTSAKDPAMRDVVYVEELVGPLTVNTIPLSTLNAILDHGKIRADSLSEDVTGAKKKLENLSSLGINLEGVCMDLQKAGVKAFADSFDHLFGTIKTALRG